MGFYSERVLPRLIDRVCSDRHLEPLRSRVCAGTAGEVLELGFGSGANVPQYPAAISRVRAVEPSDLAWRLAGRRVSASPVPISRAGLDGQRLTFADASFDCVISTFTLCTIPDANAALGEVLRVLRPDGEFRFLEHGLAPDARVRRWQRRVEPVQKRLAGGCHVTRDIPKLIESAGLRITDLETFYLDRALKVGGWCSLGAAVRG